MDETVGNYDNQNGSDTMSLWRTLVFFFLSEMKQGGEKKIIDKFILLRYLISKSISSTINDIMVELQLKKKENELTVN